MKICSIKDCGKKYLANGYCAQHNARFKKYGNPLAPIKSRWDNHAKVYKKCLNPDCDAIITKTRYCNKCRMRKHRYGDVNVVKPRGNKEIWKLAKGGGAKRKYKFDSSILNQWSPALAYILGLTITDGCIEIRKEGHIVSWHLKDKEPLEIIQRLFKTDKPIETTWKKIKSPDSSFPIRRLYYRLRLCGKSVVEKFISYGVKPRKTFNTEIPEMPPEMLPHFLRGVLDGDGCIHLRKRAKINHLDLYVDIFSGSKVFVEQIKGKVGYGRIAHRTEVGKSGYDLVFTCEESTNFLNFIYPNSEGLRLTRKWNKYQAFLLSI